MDCFAKAYDCAREGEGVEVGLSFGKWSCLGFYLGLESMTIVSFTLLLGPTGSSPVTLILAIGTGSNLH